MLKVKNDKGTLVISRLLLFMKIWEGGDVNSEAHHEIQTVFMGLLYPVRRRPLVDKLHLNYEEILATIALARFYRNPEPQGVISISPGTFHISAMSLF